MTSVGPRVVRWAITRPRTVDEVAASREVACLLLKTHATRAPDFTTFDVWIAALPFATHFFG